MRKRSHFLFIFLAAALFASSPSWAADVVATDLAAGTTDSALVSPPSDDRFLLMFCGFSSRETGDAADATVNIHDGTSTSGDLIYTFSLNGGESRGDGPWAESSCIPAPTGIFVDRGGAGTTLLVIYSRESISR